MIYLCFQHSQFISILIKFDREALNFLNILISFVLCLP
jgi:hypothetical protein